MLRIRKGLNFSRQRGWRAFSIGLQTNRGRPGPSWPRRNPEALHLAAYPLPMRRCSSTKSASTSWTMALSTGTMRGMALMSCRPATTISVAWLWRVMVCCGLEMEGDGLYGGPDDEGLAAGNTAEDSPAVVADKAVRGDGIVVPAPCGAGRGETRAYLHPLDRAHAHQGVGQPGVELVEHGLSESRRAGCPPAPGRCRRGCLPGP